MRNNNITVEEAAINKGERLLNFYSVQTLQVYLVFKRYSHSNLMSRAQFLEAAKIIGLDTSEITNPRTDLGRFYS